jgi:hypothetical protein
MPSSNGSRSIPDILTNKSRKLISMACMLSRSEGMVEDQKRNDVGVMKNAVTEVRAVSVTESATFPLASNEKKLDALPPGHAATRIIPNAIPEGGAHIRMSSMVNEGKRTYCERIPVRSAFF